MEKDKIQRLALTVSGQVQGVGFRPFIWRLARNARLTGFVRNTSAGVRIEIQGPPEALASFENALASEPPPLAKISGISREFAPLVENETDFIISQSQGHGGQNVLVSPDVGICQECLADIRDPANRRFGYAFTNCVNCGPRFSITRSIPYDRKSTCMACFPMCAACAAEYANPADRRFHAQPAACAACGPALWFVPAGATHTARPDKPDDMALQKAGQLLLNGKILALKGLGGFQLACDARNAAAVAMLRRRKNRPHKALAVMACDLEAARKICAISPQREAMLTGPEKPITLCPATPDSPLCAAIAPDTRDIGIMLPPSPLHALLLDWLHANGMTDPVLVMTSANPAGEPICLGNREALARLAHLADGWLLHDRDILCRVDDSVVAFGKAPMLIRRARGYVPRPVTLPHAADCVMGAGAELKATFCLTRGKEAFLSQHIGDLTGPASLDFYQQSLEHLQNLLETRPRLVIHDLHPDFLSSQLAREYGQLHGIPVRALQHHAAHAAAVLAENGCYEPALALCLDGTGLGADNTVWGGELIFMDLSKPAWRRLGSLATFPMPGGEAAIREPWRLAYSLAREAANAGHAGCDIFPASAKLDAMLNRKINCPRTSSCGRLFDAFAATLGLCETITYEGQAAIRLEKAALEWPQSAVPDIVWTPDANGAMEKIDVLAFFAALMRARKAGWPLARLAAAFHYTLANAFAAQAQSQAVELGINSVGLSGGVMQNSIMAEILPEFLKKRGLVPLIHKKTPPGDGGVSLGQAAWGQMLLKNNRI